MVRFYLLSNCLPADFALSQSDQLFSPLLSVTFVLLPGFLAIAAVIGIVSAVGKLHDWFSASFSWVGVENHSPVECGFDVSSTSISAEKNLKAIILVVTFEIELLLLGFLLFSSAYAIYFGVFILFAAFGFLEIALLGK